MTAPTQLATQTVKGPATSAWANQVKAWIDYLGGYTTRPVTVLRQSAPQSIPTAVYTALTMDVEEVDRDGGHTGSSSRYVAQTAGWYSVCGVYACSASGTGVRGARLAVNGAAQIGSAVSVQPNPSSATTTLATPTRPVYLAVGDYVECQGYQSSGAALMTVSVDQASSLAVWWLSS